MKPALKLAVALPVLALAGLGCLALLWAYNVSMWVTEPESYRNKGAL